ncbi:MAG: hypothetical protein AABW51_04075 [Nanoarchaeota archaeon]
MNNLVKKIAIPVLSLFLMGQSPSSTNTIPEEKMRRYVEFAKSGESEQGVDYLVKSRSFNYAGNEVELSYWYSFPGEQLSTTFKKDTLEYDIAEESCTDLKKRFPNDSIGECEMDGKPEYLSTWNFKEVTPEIGKEVIKEYHKIIDYVVDSLIPKDSTVKN